MIHFIPPPTFFFKKIIAKPYCESDGKCWIEWTHKKCCSLANPAGLGTRRRNLFRGIIMQHVICSWISGINIPADRLVEFFPLPMPPAHFNTLKEKTTANGNFLNYWQDKKNLYWKEGMYFMGLLNNSLALVIVIILPLFNVTAAVHYYSSEYNKRTLKKKIPCN